MVKLDVGGFIQQQQQCDFNGAIDTFDKLIIPSSQTEAHENAIFGEKVQITSPSRA